MRTGHPVDAYPHADPALDEHDLDAFEHHDFEGRGERHLVEASLKLRPARPTPLVALMTEDSNLQIQD